MQIRLLWFCGRVSFGSLGGIRRSRHVYIEEPFVGRVTWGVAVAVGCVLRRTECGAFFASRRLRELPDFCIRDAARRRGWRIPRERATWRRRAHIVEGPDHDFVWCCLVANVFGSGDGDGGFFFHWNAGAVDTGSKASSFEFFCAATNMLVINRGKSPDFF